MLFYVSIRAEKILFWLGIIYEVFLSKHPVQGGKGSTFQGSGHILPFRRPY